MNNESDVEIQQEKRGMTEQEFHKNVLSKCEQRWDECKKDTYGLWEHQSDDTKAEYYNNMYQYFKLKNEEV